ncbi:MAG: undecaprenyldiphospho-muramoylpentapeptide beta-N-acetylglucosaminyltransferase [Candidatus Poribacteria bacterium]
MRGVNIIDRIIISGGGTGGHIYPGIAIANELLQLKKSLEIIFVGGRDRLEASIIPRYNFTFIPISVAGFPRHLTWRWFQVIPKVLLGIADSFGLLRRMKPKAVIGTGGYVCGPVLLAAALLKIPTLIQEQNAFPGLTNRILGRFVDEIHVSFEKAAEYFNADKVRVTGNPIRREIRLLSEAAIDTVANQRYLPPRNQMFAKFGLDSGKKTVFVMGGSQGAHPINVAMIEALKRFQKRTHDEAEMPSGLEPFAAKLQIIHQTGQDDYELVKSEYARMETKITNLVQPYFENIPRIYALADLMICRTGAMTIAEITAYGLPAILIPYPHSTGDHQRINAQAMVSEGAAIIINDSELTGEVLAQELIDLLFDEQRLGEMAAASKRLGKPRAAEEIAQAVLNLAF